MFFKQVKPFSLNVADHRLILLFYTCTIAPMFSANSEHLSELFQTVVDGLKCSSGTQKCQKVHVINIIYFFSKNTCNSVILR